MDLQIDLHSNPVDQDIVTISVKAGDTTVESVDTFYHFGEKGQWKEVVDLAIELLNYCFNYVDSSEWAEYINKHLQLTDYLDESE